MRKKILSLSSIAVTIGSFLLTWSAKAADPKSDTLLNRLTNVAGQGGYETNPAIASTPIIIGTVVGAFINFLGITFIILIIIAGYHWMTANGSEEKVEKAKETIKQALIGLAVAIAAWAMWRFIFEALILKK
ncbi:MAG: hypothetical protein WC863_03610 [Patescibacteria group bacterium]